MPPVSCQTPPLATANRRIRQSLTPTMYRAASRRPGSSPIPRVLAKGEGTAVAVGHREDPTGADCSRTNPSQPRAAAKEILARVVEHPQCSRNGADEQLDATDALRLAKDATRGLDERADAYIARERETR